MVARRRGGLGIRKTRSPRSSSSPSSPRPSAGEIANLIRDHGISRKTFYRWRKHYGGMQVSDAEGARPWRRRTAGSSACAPPNDPHSRAGHPI